MSGKETFYSLAAALIPAIFLAGVSALPKERDLSSPAQGQLFGLLVAATFVEGNAIAGALFPEAIGAFTRDSVVAGVMFGMAGVALLAIWPSLSLDRGGRRSVTGLFAVPALLGTFFVLQGGFGLAGVLETANNKIAEEEEAEALSRKASVDDFTAKRRIVESVPADPKLRSVEQAEARFFAQQSATKP